MPFDEKLIVEKLLNWEGYLRNYSLPEWKEIPNFGLYMEQVIILLTDYLDYFPPELKEEQFVTAATINNYVRKHIMPEPVKKKYYRIHIAYLIIICTLKQSLNISTLQHLIPYGLEEEKVERIYTSYVSRHKKTSELFIRQVRSIAAGELKSENDLCESNSTEDLVTVMALAGGFCRLLAEKLLLLEDSNGEETAE